MDAGRPVATGGVAKRAFDLSLVLAALPFVLPVLGLVAAIVLLTSPGPVFRAHRRLGHGGREFRCLTFRTMPTDRDRSPRAPLRHGRCDRTAWQAGRSPRDDRVAIAVGAFLRRSRLDELPQLLNVLRGEMSLVGPRPIVREELARYGRSARYYLLARPGLTGLWQIGGRSQPSCARRALLDRFYVSRWSLPRDVWIVAMTVPAALAADRAR